MYNTHILYVLYKIKSVRTKDAFKVMSPNAREPIVDGEIYHVISRGNNCQSVFREDCDFEYFMKLLHKYKDKFPLEIFHYCLMHNHVHLLVRVIQGEDLRCFMQGLNHAYCLYVKRCTDYKGHLWQGRFKSYHVARESYLLECGRYIERNPVRAGIVNDPKQWPWSSHCHYAWGQDDPLIDENDIYWTLGKNGIERQSNYRQYVLSERPYEKLIDKQFSLV